MIRRFGPEVAGLPSLAVTVAERLGRPVAKEDFPSEGALIDHRGRPGSSRRSPFSTLLAGKADPALLRGRVVVIGASAPTLHDQHATPQGCQQMHQGLGRRISAVPEAAFDIRPMCEHVFALIVCTQIPRFELAIAAGGREALAAGPVALAPEAGREQLIGQASAAAEAYGVRAGLRLGEALARCPTLRLVPPDPAGVADEWERLLILLEGIGAAVEPGRPGLAWFDAQGLRTLHGGSLEGVIAAARRALATPVRIGAAPSRFAALAASSAARARRAEVAPSGAAALRAYLAPLPVALLGVREETAALPPVLERFGVRTLGELAAMPRAALADRFGEAGVRARALARGRDTPLRTRTASERLEERLELPESASGVQLERALGLLIDRLLARRERRGRTMRAAVLSARLVEGGTWRVRVTFREALADPRRMRLVLAPRLADLPAPAEALRLRAEGLSPPAADQRSLLSEPAAVRAARLREAVRQARAVAGPEAALRILPVDPDSRVPERRLALTPWEP